MNSNRKGKQGERELSGILRDQFGVEEARRGQQFCGANGDADVVGIPGIHIECKRVESLNVHKAMAQAERDRNRNDIPVVFHRKNGTEWLVTVKLCDLLLFVARLVAGVPIIRRWVTNKVGEAGGAP